MHFSVIVPSYNVERYIDECVRSAARQESGGEHEVIVVDDGSTDGTPAIVRRLAQELPNVRAFFQANDGAPGKARNRGIAEARGELLVFLDSDDRLPTGALAAYDRAAAAGGADVLAGARRVFDDASGRLVARPLPAGLLGAIRPEGRLRLRHKSLYVNASGKAFSRAFVARNGLRFPEGHPGQDTAFALACIAHADVVRCVDDVVYEVRVRGDARNLSLTQQFDPRAIARRLVTARQCLADLAARGKAQFAADARAYFLLGILSRIFQRRRRGPIEGLDAIHEAVRDFQREGRRAGDERRMSGEFRRRWLLASALVASRHGFRAGLLGLRALRLR